MLTNKQIASLEKRHPREFAEGVTAGAEAKATGERFANWLICNPYPVEEMRGQAFAHGVSKGYAI